LFGRLAVAVALLMSGPVGFGDEPAQTDDPKQIGLLEKAGRRLAQIDITVMGPPEVVSSLTETDFKIKVNFTKLTDFKLDRLCETPQADRSGREPTIQAATPGSYLFYHDQPHLTMAGRLRALELTRDLIRRLIGDGNRAMLVSNAAELAVVQPLTDDADLLLQAVDRLEHDRTQWDFYAAEEDSRVRDLVRVLNESQGIEQAAGRARAYQREERWRTDKNLRRLAHILGRMSEVDPPKAVIYFADTMRANAGEHYMSFFGQSVQSTQQALANIATDSMMAALPFDRVVNAAAAQGVRFYTVRAQGLVGLFDSEKPSSLGFTKGSGRPSTSRVRHDNANDALANLASETGGQAFAAGERGAKIAERLRRDFSCVYLASFDPTGFAEDAPLRIVVKTPRSDVKLRTRGRMVLQSASARKTARLMSAFLTADEGGGDFAIRAGLVPTGFERGLFSALLQISVPGTPLPNASWELGASVIFGEKVRDEISGKMQVPLPGTTVVFERELQFKPGSHEIVFVAHETSSSLLASDRLLVDWPQPGKDAALVGPVALLQPTAGAFMRSGESRVSGSLTYPASDPVVTDRPTALVGLVCRAQRQKGRLSVDRVLVGDSAVEFPPLVFELGQDRCAQLRDLIPANTLAPGYYRYEVSVSQEGRAVTGGGRDFLAVAP